MTHTKNKTPTPSTSWEKEFDKVWGIQGYTRDTYHKPIVKEFIKSEKKKSVRETIREISKKIPKKKEIKKLSGTRANSYGFNQALDEVNKLLADLSADKRV